MPFPARGSGFRLTAAPERHEWAGLITPYRLTSYPHLAEGVFPRAPRKTTRLSFRGLRSKNPEPRGEWGAGQREDPTRPHRPRATFFRSVIVGLEPTIHAVPRVPRPGSG